MHNNMQHRDKGVSERSELTPCIIYYFNRRPFTQAVEDEDQDVSVLSDGPTEIVTCIK